MAIDPAILQLFGENLVPIIVGSTFIGSMGWVITTWLRIKNGYPLEGSWGKPLLPAGGGEALERVKLIAQENAQLKAELGSVKDRLQVLERLAVDRGARLAAEIDALPPKALN